MFNIKFCIEIFIHVSVIAVKVMKKKATFQNENKSIFLIVLWLGDNLNLI